MTYVAQRRVEEKERRRGEILAAADRLYAEVGWDEVTMDQVARGARLSRALVYVYFRDKDDVLMALSEQAMQSLRQRFIAAAASRSTGLEQVEAIGRAYVTWAVELPHHFDACARFQAEPTKLGTESADGGPRDHYAACEEAGNGVLAVVAAAVRQGFADGSISPAVGDPDVFAISLWGFTHGIILIATKKAAHFESMGLPAATLYDHAFGALRLAMTPKT